ncbi:MAG: hypothetical protein J0I77_10970 [Rudaea sp.]|uniref:hypothetical protein n=1 Tax=unclassified Rudaea TaxID=2627037 RepID=UPI0010F9DE66|nr:MULTISPECIES: hypothetical protein [unclassified Rudaea]MBN8886234.1 hypothetical protein [Rudaea sp.]MBR0346073.1 hypothetical protein [Rudaea sp.]
MSSDHVHILDKKISALSDALAKLGRGVTLAELLKIIRNPGWTTPAEFAFATALINAVHTHIAAIETLQGELLTASKSVGVRG